MRRPLLDIANWLEHRLGLKTSLWPMMTHPIPRKAGGPMGWWYVFGSASMTLLMVQFLTGVGLAMVYVPAADEAYASLEYLNQQQDFGWFLRALHFWSASGMVVMVVIHMTQVFLFGAYKYPRELTWMVGVVLLALTLGMGFTGQVLRWDQDAYWGIGVGASMAGRVPILGPAIVHLLLGGPTVGGETLSRFFALHVFILPGLLIASLVVHLYLVLRLGVSEPPVAGRMAGPETHEKTYEAEVENGVPFFPDAVARDGIFCALAVMTVVGLAAYYGPYGPNGVPDPTLVNANPRPEWYFLPLFALLSLSPPSIESFIMLGLPPLLLFALFLVPIVSGRGERSPGRRPVAVLSVLVIYLLLGVLGWLGHVAPWSPHMTAWSEDPIPPTLLAGSPPRLFVGATVLQYKNCRNCHAVGGRGGQRGPALDGVADRLTRDELIRQVIQGGGNMPAYGKQLQPHEVEALVSFLEHLGRRDFESARPPVSY